MQKNGIDVSAWQGVIDWPRVKADGVDFVIARSSFGWLNREEQVDSQFHNNMRGAQANGIPCGAYHYSYATNPEEAALEAEFFLKVIDGYQFKYPLAYDIEDEVQAGLSRRQLTDIAYTFLDRIRKEGYYACITSSLNWILNKFDMERLSEFDLWLAQWNSRPTYDGDIGLWQYTSTGSVNGIRGNVDLDIAFRDYPAIIGGEPPEPEPGNPMLYTVVPGDTLSGIAQKFGISLSDLILANPQLKNPDLIYAGNILRIPVKSVPLKRYTVVSGDTLSGIAAKFGISLSDLILANPQLKNPDLIYAGQVLILP